MIVLMLRSRTSYTHNQFEKSLILTAPPSTLVGRCAGSHTLNDFSSLRADSLVSTLILLLDEVEGGKILVSHAMRIDLEVFAAPRTREMSGCLWHLYTHRFILYIYGPSTRTTIMLMSE
jgi:hypothetical protein